MTQPQRILIVNPFGIGDVLFTTPLIRALRAAFPNSYVAYLCNRRTEGILQHNPHLDAIFVYERDEIVALWRRAKWQGLRHVGQLLGRARQKRFDLVIDLSLGERYSFLLTVLGVRRRIGFNYRNRGRFLTEALAIDGYHEDHVVEYYRRFLHFLGIRLRDGRLEVRLSEEDRVWAQAWAQARRQGGAKVLVGMVPAGGVSWGIDAPFRRWGAEGFAAVGNALVERLNASVVLFGEASDAPVCRTVSRVMRYPVLDLSGQTSVGRFVGLLSQMDLVICNDGGPLHLAVTQGVRTVSVFGPVDPAVYGPYPPDALRHAVIIQEELPCRPCYHQFKLPPCPYERACLTTISPTNVIDASIALLNGMEVSATASSIIHAASS